MISLITLIFWRNKAMTTGTGSTKKQEEQVSRLGMAVNTGSINPENLTAVDWKMLVSESLSSCKSILPQMAKEYGQAKTFLECLNHNLEGSFGEKRITKAEIFETLPKAFLVNDGWLLIPVGILSTSEEKGQFFERSLFIIADLAALLIVDVFFRKEPIEGLSRKENPPKINENVVECRLFADSSIFEFDTREEFNEIILPFYADPKLKLGKNIIDYTLERAVAILREKKRAVTEMEESLRRFLGIRDRLGVMNHL